MIKTLHVFYLTRLENGSCLGVEVVWEEELVAGQFLPVAVLSIQNWYKRTNLELITQNLLSVIVFEIQKLSFFFTIQTFRNKFQISNKTFNNNFNLKWNRKSFFWNLTSHRIQGGGSCRGNWKHLFRNSTSLTTRKVHPKVTFLTGQH